MEKFKNITPSILKFAENIQEYLRIFKAFVKGYEAFMSELKGGLSYEKEKNQ